jgi:hypothetical protein
MMKGKAEIPVPKELQGRPVHGGYVTPYFVAWYREGKMVHEKTPGAIPHFPTVDVIRATHCRKQNLCWCCGKQLGTFKWFVFGPASAVVRQSVEPPSHRDCAHYAAQVCPFIVNPNRTAGAKPVRPGTVVNPGVSAHHPGVCVLWATRTWTLLNVEPKHGIYWFQPGEPETVEFWREGRKATRQEIQEAFDRSLKMNNIDPKDREYAWRVEFLMRFAPEE